MFPIQIGVLTLIWLTFASSSSLTPAVNPLPPPPHAAEFVSHLLTNKFVTCSIIFIRIFDNDRSDLFDSILRRNPHDAFLLQLDGEVRGHSSILSKFGNLSDVHRFRPSCTAAIFVASSFPSTLGNSLYSEVKKWSAIIKKDEDYYIFLATSGEPSEELLLSSDIGAGIKFKILVQSNPNSVEITTTCFYCNFGSPKVLTIPWEGMEDSESSLSSLFPDLSQNFHGKTLAVGTPTGTRWLNEIHRLENGRWVAKRGLYSIVMTNLMSAYNFSADFFPSLGNGGTGSKLKNGSWLGSVGNVVGGSADIGHVTGQTWSRNKVVGFTYPVSYEMLTFTSGEPLPYFSWKAILWPLSKEMWIGLGGSFILANFVLFLVIKRTPEHFDLTHILSYTFASVLEQDVPSAERLSSNPWRVFVTFWLFFTLVISTAYRSKLVSLLSFPNVEEAPKTFEALAASDYTYALQYLRGAAYALLGTSPNPTYKKIFGRMELEEDDVKCFQRAIGSRFVCISWSRIADFIFKRNLSDQYGRVPVIKAPVTTCFLSVGIITQKRAIYLGNFNALIIAATDTGLLERWWVDDMNWVYNERRNWERGQNRSEVKEGGGGKREGDNTALTNKHFRSSYYLLGCGSGVAGIVFIWEVILFRKHLIRKNKNALRMLD